MRYVHKFLQGAGLTKLIYRVQKNLSTQRKFLRQNIDPILKEAFENNDGSLDDNDLKKINHYYGLAVPAILGEAFATLRGKDMSAAERWASTCQGAMTGLFDDFFDKDYLGDGAIEKMISAANGLQIKRSNQLLFDQFYKKALEYAPGKEKMQKALSEVYKAQVESKRQKNVIANDELLKITFYKGGSSLLFYRTAFSHETSDKETSLLYDLGGLMQLANDIFDVYKDRESGIKTLLTETKDIKDIRDLFKTHLDKYYKTAFETGYPEKNVRRFLNIISIAIFSRCFVCLAQLEQNEKLTGNKFSVHEYSRKQLICDMDKRSNMLRSAWSHINDIR